MSNYNITDIEAVNEQPDQNRRFAERLLTRLDRNQGFSWEQVASFSKWLTASLLAVNGAGGLAALSLLKEGGGSWLPAVLFGVGLLMALLSGTALQHFYNAMAMPLLDHDNYWTTVLIDGVRDGHLEEKLQAQSDKSQRFSAIAPGFGWCSGLSFIAGSIALAVATASAGEPSKAVCLSLERDMLSAKPKRTNSAEIFQSLNCKATGRI
ncbi:MAG TPA: hypothetical protein VGB70_02965 [Allosphingosinicella sp.]|jgi:hypothetical protein